MHRIRKSLPSLSALIAFEAAARRSSFTRAAGELGVTQAAVSRRISALENEIGSDLFERHNRRVSLTAAGQELFETVLSSFDALADTVDKLREPKKGLSIAVSIAFAHFRLLPVLAAFRDSEPDIDLRVISEDAWMAPDDAQIDLAVRYGKPPFRGMKVIGSIKETVVPVCTPSIAKQFGRLTLSDLAQRTDIPKIDSASPEPSWLNWAGWLHQVGWQEKIEAPKLHFSNYSDAAYAAMNGEGIALGWTHVLERPLADGRLVKLDIAKLTPRERHYILIPKARQSTAEVDAFSKWISGITQSTE